jgi:hypothetical protein
MDPSVKKMLKDLQDLEFKRSIISRDIDALKRVLTRLGVKPDSHTLNEGKYAVDQPFKEMALTEACLKVLKDHKGEWLTASQIEYLIARGGYEFSTKTSRNSVDVTLRRFADAGTCDADRTRGSRGNRYRWMPEKEQSHEVEDSRATKGKT